MTFTYASSVAKLNLIFALLNEKYFENSLPEITITIQSTRGAYGHFSLDGKTWSDSSNNGTHEININPDEMDRPIANVAATLLHEMVHFYNFVNGIKDTSNGNVYHNKRFKEAAEARGLIIGKHDTYGWTITTPSEELIAFLNDNDIHDMELVRYRKNRIPTPPKAGDDDNAGSDDGDDDTTPTRTKKPSSTRKYICPSCGNSCRATKVLNLICGDCMETMVVAE